MKFDWLKRYMPRSLQGRAALILILPVATLQLVVSIVFIQRHFEDVTTQMTRNVLAEVRYLVDRVNLEPDLAEAQTLAERLAPELGLSVYMPVEGRVGDRRAFYDLSGRVVIEVLRQQLPGVTGIDLRSNPRAVLVSIETEHGGMELVLPRGRVSASNPHQLLVLMIVTGILMTLISYLFLRNQLRPITRLASAAEDFGKGRRTDYKPAGAHEVRSAGQAFLAMRNRIDRQIEQRTMMLSGVSHDLRTPLTRMKLALSMMEDSDDVEALQRDVSDMQRLVDEFLSFARGDALDDAVSTDAAALVREVSAKAARAGSNVRLGPIDETGDVALRPVAIARALENLIGNAVRYGTRAIVSLENRARSIVISVEDDGPGIAPEDVEEALKPFARLDPARNQNRSGGVGLGLAIAADIARQHGGALRLGPGAELGGLRADLELAR